MLFCLHKFLLCTFDIVGRGHYVLIESDELLSLILYLYIDVFCDGVDVLHD